MLVVMSIDIDGNRLNYNSVVINMSLGSFGIMVWDNKGKVIQIILSFIKKM